MADPQLPANFLDQGETENDDVTDAALNALRNMGKIFFLFYLSAKDLWLSLSKKSFNYCQFSVSISGMLFLLTRLLL